MAPDGHAPGSAVVGVTLAFTILATIATVLRLYTRIAIVRSAGVDDIVISLAIIFSIVLTITMCQQVKYGMGRHQATLSADENVQSLIWFWASVWIYYVALCFAKLSILLQYLRIFPVQKFRIGCYSLMGIIVAWTFWAFFSALLACWPIRHFWHRDIPGTCLNRLAVWFSNAAVNIITDICTAVLPLPVLNSLNLPKKQKYMLMAVFGLGGVTCIVSILRLSALDAVSKSPDVSYENPLAAIWSSLEVNVGILCSCIPTLKGCVSRYFPTLFHSSSYAASRRDTPVFELSGSGKSQATCIAMRSNIDPRDREKGGNRRMSRPCRRFAGGGAEIKEADEGRGSESTPSDEGNGSPAGGRAFGTSPSTMGIAGIQVTTIVEQVEEMLRRESEVEIGRHESESIKGLVPTVPFEGT